MNQPNPHQYAKDWHHCVDCGCLMPDRELRQWHRIDKVLDIDEVVTVCKDPNTCRRFKKFRDEVLKREADAVLKAISAKPITPRRKAS